MNIEDFKLHLFRYGHFLNPVFPTDIRERYQLERLTLTCDPVVAAVKSYQSFFAASLDRLSLEFHRRTADADGEPGPATYQLAGTPRCGVADFQAANVQEANWPGACRNHILFGRTFRALPGLSQADTDKVFWAACNNWTHALGDVEIDSRGYVASTIGLQIIASLGRLSGSTLAWSHIATSNCDAVLQQRYNSVVNWSRMSLAVTTATHELGHALGFYHHRDPNGLLYPQINQPSMSRMGFPNPTDLATARASGYSLSGLERPNEDLLFGAWHGDHPDNKLGPVEDPDPPPPPGDDLDITGILQLVSGGNVIREFIPVERQLA